MINKNTSPTYNYIITSKLDEMIDIAKATLKYSQVGISGCRNACALLAQDKKGNRDIFEGCNIELSTSTVIHAERLALFNAILHGYTFPIAIVMAIKDDKVAPACGYIAPMCGYCRQDYMYVNPELRVFTLNNKGKITGYKLKDTLIKPYMSKGKISHDT